MKTLYITGCVADGNDPNRALDIVFGRGWSYSLEMAVEMQQEGLVEFRALAPGRWPSVKVEVRKSVSGLHFLRTHPDAVTYNNLESLVVVSSDWKPVYRTLLGRPPYNALAMFKTVLES